MIHFTNRKGERLPEDINKVANERYDPKFSPVKPNPDNELDLGYAFDWESSLEGYYIWDMVQVGNNNTFYYHKQSRKAEIIAEIEKLQNELKEL